MNRLGIPLLLLGLVGCYRPPADLEGKACSSDATCGAGYRCVQGGCHRTDAPTSSGAATTGGHSGASSSSNSSSGATTGHSSVTSSSGSTGRNTSTSSTGTSGCGAPGQGCQRGGDCCSGACNFSSCVSACVSADDFCDRDDACCSRHCGRDGRCHGGGTTSTTASSGSSGTTGCGTRFARCNVGADCCSGACDFGACLDACGNDGFFCDRNEACCSGLCGPNGLCISGGTTSTVGTTGTFGTSGSTGTTGTCRVDGSQCLHPRDCCSLTCNPDGQCVPQGQCCNTCTNRFQGCMDFGNGSCSCVIPSTNTTGTIGTSGSFGTSGTTGTTGTGRPICAACTQDTDCASSFCNTWSGPAGFCDTINFCSPAECAPYGCNTQNGVCDCTQSTGSIGTTGTFGTTGSMGTTGTTGGGLPICASCTQSTDCASQYCNLFNGSPGYCDSTNACTTDNECAPFGCDLTSGDCICQTGTTGTTSTTGTVGTTGTTGTTGGCASTPGTTDSNCGTSHAICEDGTHCGSHFAQSGQTYYACACTQADQQTGATDSCLVNDVLGGNGKTACDEQTLNCRAPRDLEPIFHGAMVSSDDCASGYLPRNFGAQADGGQDMLCVQPCASNRDCTAIFTACNTQMPVVATNPDGTTHSYPGSCYYNFCGPDLNPGSGVRYYGPCDSAGAGDGTCQPLPSGAGLPYIGVCLRNGPQPLWGSCSGFLGQASSACQSGLLCIASGQPADACVVAQAGTCVPACNAASPDAGGPVTPACPVTSGIPTSCHTFDGEPDGGPVQAGLCY